MLLTDLFSTGSLVIGPITIPARIPHRVSELLDVTTPFVTNGVLVWNGLSFVTVDLSTVLTSQVIFTKSLVTGVGSIAFATSITPNCDDYNTLNIGTLTDNITINAPLGTPADSQILNFRFTEDSVGNYIINWNSIFAFGWDVTTGMIPTAANSKWEITSKYNAVDGKWRIVGLSRGF